MRKANWSVVEEKPTAAVAANVLRRACQGVVGRLEALENRQMLTLVVHWPLVRNPDFPTDVFDTALDNGSDDGFLSGDASWVPDRNATANSAIDLDGDEDSITNLSSYMPYIGGTASVSFWVKTTQTGNENPALAPAVIGNGGDIEAENIAWGFLDHTGRIGLWVAGATPTGATNATTMVKSTLPINDGQWHHITMTRNVDAGPNQGRIEIWVDGFLNQAGTANATVRPSNTATSGIRDIGLINHTSGTFYFKGQLDEFMINQDEVVDASTIASRFNPSGLPPTTPGSLASTYSGARAVRLTWTPSANASYYEVWRKVAGSADPFVKDPVNALASGFYTTGLLPETQYEFYVVAVNPSAPSAESNHVFATTIAAATPGSGDGLLGIYFDEDGGPTQGGDMTPYNSRGRIAARVDPVINFDWPGQPHPQIQPDSFTVSWQGQLQAQYNEPYTFFKRSDDGMIFEIETSPGVWVGTADWDYQGKGNDGLPGLQVAVVNLVAGQKYNIRAEMFEGGGGAGADLLWQSPSTPVQIIPTQQLYAPPPGLPPAAPSGLAAEAGTGPGEVRLTWNDNSNNEVGFVILRSSTGQTGTFAEIARAGGASEFIDRTFPGTNYFYQVQAFNFGGTSNSSNNANAQANATVRGLLVSYYNAVFDQLATEPSGALSGQEVQADPDVNWGENAPLPGVGPDNFTSLWEGTLNVPETGTYTFMSNSDDGVYIHVGGQLVFNDPTYHGTDPRIIGPAVELTAGPQTFRMRSWDGCCGAAVGIRWKRPDGVEEVIPSSAFGNLVVPTPGAPGAAAATNVLSRRLTVNWTDSTGEAAYFLERASSAAFTDAKQVAQLAAGVTSFTDTGLTANTTYFYRVRAASLGGHSTWTTVPGATGVTTLAVEPLPNAPSNLVAALRPGNQAVIQWQDNSLNETTFQLERSVGGGAWAPLATLQANVTRYTDTGLVAGENYNYRVKAVNVDGIESAYSNEEDVTNTPGTLSAPWANTDIGETDPVSGAFTNPALPGSVFVEPEEQQFVVTGGGSDIWDPRDRFHYLYQPVTGDFQATVRVVGMTDPATDVWAKAGLMIRETLSPSSQHAFNAVTPGNQVHFQGRLKTDDPASTVDDVNSFNDAAPAGSQNFTGWVRLVRTGQLIQSFWSPDGVTWTANGNRTYGTPQTFGTVTYPADPLDNTVYVGLASTSHDNTELSSGVFTNFDLFILPPPTVAVTNVEATAVPGNKIAVSWDDNARGTGQGNFYAGSYRVLRSANGGAYEQVGGERPIGETTYLDSGLTPGVTYTYKVVAANNNGVTPDSNTDSATAATGTGGVLPAGWQTQDVGTVGMPGSVNFLDQPGEADDVFELEGGGADIWGTADEFRFAYRQLSGEFIITARVVFQENTAEWSKAGLEIRNGTDANAQHIGLYATGNHDPEFSRRQVVNEATDNLRPWNSENTDAPTWLRLVRQDTNPDPAVTNYVVLGYASRNGGVTWDQIGGGYTIPSLAENVNVGLAVSAVNDGTLSTAEFDNVSIQQGLPVPSVALTNVEATAVPGNKIAVSWDDSARGNGQGNFYASSYRVLRSADGGTTWDPVGGVRPISQTTYLDSGLTEGTSYTYKVVAVNNTGVSPDSNVDGATAAAGTATLPGAWQTTDVGAVGTVGSVAYLDQPGDADDVFELNGGGADIWGTQDEFRYVYQQVTGDFTITTRVVFQERTAEWTKTGIDVREDLTTGSRHAGLFATGDHDPEFTRRRVATTGDSDNFRPYGNANTDAPVWLRISRQGSTATGGGTLLAWVSRDGVTWDPVDTDGATAGHQGITDPNLPAQVYVGLAASAVNDAEVSTAEFDNVTLTTDVLPPTGITLTGTAANDNWFIKRVGDKVQVWNNADGSGAFVSEHDLGSSLTVNGADGDDTVTIDMSGGNIDLSSLTIAGDAGGDKVKLVNSDGTMLTLGAVPTLNGKSLDIGKGDLKITGTTIAAVDALLASARNGATRWQGPGIGTSENTTLTGLAPIQQDEDVLVKYTYNGDANGDGRINADDYFRIDQAFLGQPANPTYFQGDFNYDQTVNADDYFLIDQAFLGQGAPLGSTSVEPVAAVASRTSTAVVVEEETKKTAARRSSGESLFSSRRIEKRSVRSRR